MEYSVINDGSFSIDPEEVKSKAGLFVSQGIKIEMEEINSVAFKLEINKIEIQEEDSFSLKLGKSEESPDQKYQVSRDIHEIKSSQQNSEEEMEESRKAVIDDLHCPIDVPTLISSEGRERSLLKKKKKKKKASSRLIKLQNHGHDEAVDVMGSEPDFDWNDRLIQAIREKPAIYNKEMKEYSDRNYISRVWTEIGETVVPLWHEMTTQGKIIKGKEIQQRWRNLRTCFRREINKQMKPETGQTKSKRRKYIYFDQLLFLLPTMDDRDTLSESSPPQREEDHSENEDSSMDGLSIQSHSNLVVKMIRKAPYDEASLNILKDNKTEKIVQLTTMEDRKSVSKSTPLSREEANSVNEVGHVITSEPSIQTRNNLPLKRKKKVPSYEEELLNILREKRADEVDEDRLFLLSLVPSFKKMTGAKKIEAKMEVLSVIRRICQP